MKIILLNISFLLVLITNAQTKNLKFYQEQAKINSVSIQRNINANKRIQLNIRQIKNALSKPQVNLEGHLLISPIISHDQGSNRFQLVSDGSSSDYTGYDLSYSDGGQYRAVVSVKQSLLNGNKYKAYSQQADIAQQLNTNEITLSKHELELLVNHQYLICLKSEQQSQISRALIEKLEQQFQQLEKLVEHAIYKQTDLLLLKLEIDNYKQDYRAYISEYQNNISNLNLLCGIVDTNTIQLEQVDFKLKDDITSSSQFLTKYKLDSLNIEAEQFIFDQKYKAQVNLFANAGLNAIYLPTANRLGFASGINFSWTIFDGNQKQIQYEKSRIAIENLEFEKQNFIRQKYINKNRYLKQIETINTQIQHIEQQLNDYRELLDLYKFEVSQAQISIMDFKNLIRDISAKKQSLLVLKTRQQALINSYNYWNY